MSSINLDEREAEKDAASDALGIRQVVVTRVVIVQGAGTSARCRYSHFFLSQ